VCALAVFAGQQAAAPLSSPLAALLAGGAAAALTMAAILLFRPDALGREAQTALARLLPAIGPRLTPREGTAT